MKHHPIVAVAAAALVCTAVSVSAEAYAARKSSPAIQPPSAEVDLFQVSADSLINYLRRDLSQIIYYVRDTSDKNTYTLKAPASGIGKSIVNAFRERGYTVLEHDGAKFILRGHSFALSLPDGYFDNLAKQESSTAPEMVEQQRQQLTFQNKIYEVGDKRMGKRGSFYLSGTVSDVKSGDPIAGVAVVDEKSGNYTQTDSYGQYKIMLTQGEHKITYSGYSLEDLTLNVEMYDHGALDVPMKERVFALKAAIVTAESRRNHRTASIGVEKIRINELKSIPMVFGEADVIKAILTLPGVKSVGEASSGFNVRGGASDQNLILFNGGTIFNPNHMFGILSAFNSDVINDVELFKSSVPVQYGGRISSVLDVKGREGNPKNLKGSLGVGVLTSHLHLEGPLKKEKTTFLIGGRTTYSNWILNLIPSDKSEFSDGKAYFYDFNAGLSHKFNQKNSLHINAYYSADKFSFSNKESFKYNNLNASVKWRRSSGERYNMEAIAGYDQYSHSISDLSSESEASKVETVIRQGFAKFNFKYALSPSHTITYGLDAVMYSLSPGTRNPIGENSVILYKKLDTERAIQPDIYFGDTWKVNNRLILDMGVRLSSYSATGDDSKFYFGPEVRFSGKYSIRENLSVKAGFNSMRQYIHMISNTTAISPVNTWKLADSRIKPQLGWQAAAGLYWTVAGNTVDLSLEGYYKRMSQYPDYRSGATLSMNENLADDLLETKGQSYGIEFMAKKPSGKLNGWFSYTYSKTQLRALDGSVNRGEWYDASYDKPHEVKLMGNYKFTHRYSFSINLDYSTGRPVTVPIGSFWYDGGYRLLYSDRNKYRIPDYFRMDVAFIIEPGHYLRRLTHMSITFGVYNVTGRKNAYSVYYTATGGATPQGTMLSIFATQIPYINFNIKF